MERLIHMFGACSLAPAWDRSPYESLVRSVTHQQLRGSVAEKILGRLIALFPSQAFPRPEDIEAADEAALRGAGLSANKIASLRDIARHAIEGKLPTRVEAESMDDAELVFSLTAIRGVGRWTVEMMLIFTLGRLDVFPADDFGVRNGMRLAYGFDAMPTKRQAQTDAQTWQPYRSIASWYLWRVSAVKSPPSSVRESELSD
ncbi:MAG: DNA-3-methyladenine glycosylase 2 family protein [Rhodospirillales bacterium]|nr:DNA-3-methyladenine glycosylase 2 family protein [Rhodospirillales bacterium]